MPRPSPRIATVIVDACIIGVGLILASPFMAILAAPFLLGL